MPLHCQALVIHCIDFRFVSAIRDFLVSRGLREQYDLVSLAGASKGLVGEVPAGAEIIFRQIKIATQFHDIKEIILIHHIECLAYQSQYAFESVEAERQRLIADMDAVKNVIIRHYPYLRIVKVLANTNHKLEFIP
jgi:hypothetical protein